MDSVKDTNKIETKNFECEFKTMNDNDMEIEGYASIFGNMDSYRDIVENGAFTRTLKNNMKRIKMLWQHDVYEPIGKPSELYEDSKGLYFKAKISKTDMGKKAYILMKDKVVDEISIGYNTINYNYDKEKDIRRLTEVRLLEFSPVTFASNPKAKISNVKSEFDNLSLELKSLRESITGFNKPTSNKSIYDLLLSEIKSGNLIKDNDKNKIENLIKALMALIEPEQIDSSQDTQSKQDNPPSINKIDESVIKESEIIQELINRWN